MTEHARDSGGAQAPGRTWKPEAVERRHPLALDYRLVVMTNGRPCLRETLEAWRERVTPQPSSVFIHDDGGQALDWGGGTPWANVPYWHERIAPSVGFCRSVARAWAAGAIFPWHGGSDSAEWVFWLEDDLVVQREVDLEQLAAVLDVERRVSQMALMRQAVNDEEIAAGGCFELRRDLYDVREGWLHSRTNFSTTASLMRRDFMREQPMPPGYLEGCEGRYSIDLLNAGYAFGVWGGGEPWVKHIGVRSGHGY